MLKTQICVTRPQCVKVEPEYQCEESLTHEIQNEAHDLIMIPEQEFEIKFSTCYSLLL